jgi:MerR family transcriptional regulator/heat shock protein HspR
MTTRQTQGIYLISVVAETLDMHPQTLRKYERAGFVVPLRVGALRTYSDEDVARLRLVKHFVDDMGLNLAGVQLALRMTSELLALRQETAANGPVERIDGMLATLGVRVVQRPRPEPAQEPGDSWFRVGPGEAVEFDTGAGGKASGSD